MEKERMPSIKKRLNEEHYKHYITGQFSLDRLATIEEIAAQKGLSFEILAKAGEEMPSDIPGHRTMIKISEGFAYIKIGNIGREGLSKFWKKVDKKCPLPRQ